MAMTLGTTTCKRNTPNPVNKTRISGEVGGPPGFNLRVRRGIYHLLKVYIDLCCRLAQS